MPIIQVAEPPSPPSVEEVLKPSDSLSSSVYDADRFDAGLEDMDWLTNTRVGYDGGFVIANRKQVDLQAGDLPFQLQINGWGQLRHSYEKSNRVGNYDVNQFALKRGRLIFQGSAFTPDFFYFIQLDGRSSSGDDVRLLDYFLSYDVGRHRWGLQKGVFGFRTGKYKMPFQLARYLSGRELEFTDRSMASTFFDVNRSFAWGLYGNAGPRQMPLNWEVAVFNGLVTGGAETGSSGTLDNNFAYSGRVFWYPTGEWGIGELADFEWHCEPATRFGMGFANSAIDEFGTTEYDAVRVVDSGEPLSTLLGELPTDVTAYTVNLFALDASIKYRGWSTTLEYYFRNIGGFQGAALPDLFDHGFWFQTGKFIIPDKLQLLARWSRVMGNSGTLGVANESSDEVAGGLAWYFREQHSKIVCDMTRLNGAPISSSSLGIQPGDSGVLFRTQIQFSF
ncbi:MAG: hypothetical protein P8J33_12430 [Pirellulaceae bacterium]|nr:hypothetical protein [Pirellulaceae bacterium]